MNVSSKKNDKIGSSGGLSILPLILFPVKVIFLQVSHYEELSTASKTIVFVMVQHS